ncbi:class I SAM-dependent methyltransferase [Geminicoccus roseus]|uniref:class I SAM-dependent methyltransferase n=1 Tax=Geminicoccus roseus TaxID=404900 RepID=UPI0003F7A03B|nr:methyltransferase domain-containing protein [Geminicoccus roseus]
MSDDAFDRFERDVHDRLAPSYRDLFEPVTALAVEGLLDAAGVRPGGRHGDLACGSGIVALGALERGAEVEAFDLSPGMLAILHGRAPEIQVASASVERLPVEDRHFDTLTMSFGIGHLSAPDAAIAEARRVLKPGGRIALSWWSGPDENRVNGLFVDLIEELALTAPPDLLPPGPPIFRFADRKALVGLLDEAGFEDICLESLGFRHVVPAAADWWDIGQGAFARVSAILGAQSDAARERVRALFLERAETYRTGDGISIPIKFHLVSGSVSEADEGAA